MEAMESEIDSRRSLIQGEVYRKPFHFEIYRSHSSSVGIWALPCCQEESGSADAPVDHQQAESQALQLSDACHALPTWVKHGTLVYH